MNEHRSSGMSSASSADTIRQLISQHQTSSSSPSVVPPPTQSSMLSAVWTTPSNHLRGGEMTKRAAYSNTTGQVLATSSSSQFSFQEENQRLLKALMDLESSKDREIDHLKIRVGQLTKKVAELEASLQIVHRSLEEEAATSMGLQGNVERLALRASWVQWKCRMQTRRFRGLCRSSDTALSRIQEAWSTLTRQAPDATATNEGGHRDVIVTPERKALEELAFCEKQWAQDRIAFVSQSLEAFRLGSEGAAGEASRGGGAARTSSSQHPASFGSISDTVSLVKSLTEKHHSLFSARFQVLQSSFKQYRDDAHMERLLQDAMDVLNKALSTVSSFKGVAARPLTEETNLHQSSGTGGTSSATLRGMPRLDTVISAASYDFARDAHASLVTLCFLPPAVQLLRSSISREGDHAAPGLLLHFFDAVDAILLQKPLYQQVERRLRGFLAQHTQLVPSSSSSSLSSRSHALDDYEMIEAHFFVEKPPQQEGSSTAAEYNNPSGVVTSSEVLRRLVHATPREVSSALRSNSPTVTTVQTPRQRPLRWDLVHHAQGEATSESPRLAASRSHGSGELVALRRGEEDTPASRLLDARHALSRVHRTALL